MRESIASDEKRLPHNGGAATDRVRWIKTGLVVAIAIVVVAAIVTILSRRSLPMLTAQALATAEARWRQAGIAEYQVEIAVAGNQPAVYLVEVAEREPVAASRNGIPLTQRRTWETWTVPGMFDTLASDVAASEARENLVVRCQFNPVHGLPERYQRIELGTGQQVTWEVKRFISQ